MFNRRIFKVWIGNLNFFALLSGLGLMHGSNLALVRCCEGIEALAGKV